MKESLANLIKLHAVDQQLLEIEELIGDLPSLVKKLKNDLEVLETASTDKQARLGEIETESRSHKAIVHDTREHLKKYQDQLLVVSTNRAYDALMHEIDTCKKTIDDSDQKRLELIEEEERLQDEVKDVGLQIEEKRKVVDVNEASLKVALAETKERADDLNGQRKELVSHIESHYIRTYDRIRAARGGSAMSTMGRDSCGVCYNRIPPQRQLEIRALDKIITCDNCGVWLYWDDSHDDPIA